MTSSTLRLIVSTGSTCNLKSEFPIPVALFAQPTLVRLLVVSACTASVSATNSIRTMSAAAAVVCSSQSQSRGEIK